MPSAYTTISLSTILAPIAKHSSLALETRCPICLDPYSADPYMHASHIHCPVQIRNINGCTHVFGTKCLRTWLRGHNTCPMCRAELYHRPISYWEGDIHPRGTHTQDLFTLSDFPTANNREDVPFQRRGRQHAIAPRHTRTRTVSEHGNVNENWYRAGMTIVDAVNALRAQERVREEMWSRDLWAGESEEERMAWEVLPSEDEGGGDGNENENVIEGEAVIEKNFMKRVRGWWKTVQRGVMGRSGGGS
ncbi:hypothetical protein CC86DRAFT_377682 [Ophiobolus disseminans]|uniref:RING-type domain-containing protein n=1 Tax=Ophiobolus disseminans TaxID=1469910 RepID=A0A6A7AIN3_9PLEO|nr:hypothetical protein CC86DRAFT_377682 [Ophiobolus disseminans]